MINLIDLLRQRRRVLDGRDSRKFRSPKAIMTLCRSQSARKLYGDQFNARNTQKNDSITGCMIDVLILRFRQPRVATPGQSRRGLSAGSGAVQLIVP